MSYKGGGDDGFRLGIGGDGGVGDGSRGCSHSGGDLCGSGAVVIMLVGGGVSGGQGDDLSDDADSNDGGVC